jgi:glycosyltransferase involved in cell wall biosynthesis
VRAAAGRHPPTRLPTVMSWPAFRSENPYNVALYREMQLLGAAVSEFSPWGLLRTVPDIVHFHWPDITINRRSLPRAVARGVALLMLVAAARARGARVVWTVHNLQSHERRHPRLERWFWRGFVALLSGFTALSPGGMEAARRRHPGLRRVPGFVIPSGHFLGLYPDELTDEAARLRLGIAAESKVIGFLGQIRAYKNVPHLVRTFRQLPDPGLRLLVAGRPDSPELADEIRTAAGEDARIRCVLAHVPDDEIQLYLRACDVVTLPFTDVLNSGSALLALAFGRRVLVPALGAMGELRDDVGEAWVRTYSGELTAEELRGALAWADGRAPGRCSALDTLTWASVARRTLDAYAALGAPR